jgi:hypothetical protein
MSIQSWLSPLVSFIGALAGGIFGGYISKRGEIRAVHAELAKVVQQNREITKATEEIKASISSEAWKRDLKKEACYDLLRQLKPLADALAKLLAAHKQHNPEFIQEAQIEFATAYGRYMDAQIILEMVGSVALIKELRNLTNTIHVAHTQIKAREMSEAWATVARFATANEIFMNACRRELGFEELTA